MLIGPKASSCEIDEFRQKLLATPHEYIAQPTLALSVAPTLTTAGWLSATSTYARLYSVLLIGPKLCPEV